MRQEDFKKAAEEYDDSPDVVQGIIARTGFEFGAEYGYQYAVDKACDVLVNKLGIRIDIMPMFRKAMEE